MTITTDALFQLDGPTFSVVSTTNDAFENLYLRFAGARVSSCTRKIRGNKSRTSGGFFDETAAALQFPYYFGENWAAFDDCITDLEWIVGDAYLLMINDAELLFADEPDVDFATLVRHLERARRMWRTPNQFFPRHRLPTPFHLLLQCSEAGCEDLTRRLTTIGSELGTLELPDDLPGRVA